MDQQKIEYQGSKIKQRPWKGFTHTCAHTHTHTHTEKEGGEERDRENERDRERQKGEKHAGIVGQHKKTIS